MDEAVHPAAAAYHHGTRLTPRHRVGRCRTRPAGKPTNHNQPANMRAAAQSTRLVGCPAMIIVKRSPVSPLAVHRCLVCCQRGPDAPRRSARPKPSAAANDKPRAACPDIAPPCGTGLRCGGTARAGV